MKKPFSVRISEVYVARAVLGGLSAAPDDVRNLFATEFAAGVSTALAALVDDLRANNVTDISVEALMARFNKQVSFALQVSTHGHDFYSETVNQWRVQNEAEKHRVRTSKRSSAGDAGGRHEADTQETCEEGEECIACTLRKALEAAFKGDRTN